MQDTGRNGMNIVSVWKSYWASHRDNVDDDNSIYKYGFVPKYNINFPLDLFISLNVLRTIYLSRCFSQGTLNSQYTDAIENEFHAQNNCITHR
jgi:hypothetical protein